MISVDVLRLGAVILPDWHPRSADVTCPIQGWAIRHPDGVVVFDTGVGAGNELIDELYRPDVIGVVDALNGLGIDERDVVAIVNSHLHFDHCGQNPALPWAPVWVQRAEAALVDEPHFTVPEWARVSPGRQRSIDGDTQLAPGLEIVATPGHTPGHQSLLIHDGTDVVVLGGQCCYTCAEFDRGTLASTDVHDESWLESGLESLRRLRSLAPAAVHLSHDPAVWRPS